MPPEKGEEALRLTALGYPVFPCAPGAKKPVAGSHGFQDASTDPGVVLDWWTETPDANIGMSTRGLLVVDVDGAENPWLSRDPDLAVSLLSGPVATTPRGGRHHIFRQPAGKAWRNTAGKLAPKVDTRADGGYVLVAPSEVDGKFYRYLPGHELDCPAAGLPEPPEWLAGLLDAEQGGSVRDVPRSSLAVVGNAIPPGMRNDTLARMAGSLRRIGMGYDEIAAALIQTNAQRCKPPLPEREVLRTAASVCRYEPDQISVAMIEDWAGQDGGGDDLIVSSKDLVLRHPNMHPPVIHDLLREGEVMNVIAPPKMNKSWMAIDMGLATCTGRKWLGTFFTERGDVLIVDNELHAATSANRIPRVAEARGIPAAEYENHLFVANLRGQLKDLEKMRPFFDAIKRGRFKMIVLDAFYRFLPPRTDENDNGSITGLYNLLDRHAARLGCAFVLIHHSSKGVQSFKDVTDVGAGAGAQARATDTHLILRRHKEDGVVVLESAIRSWPPRGPLCLRLDFPVWNVAKDLDPTQLRLEGRRGTGGAGEDSGTEEPGWTLQGFVDAFLSAEPRLKDLVLAEANEQGLNDHKAGRLLAKAEAAGLAYRWDMGGRKAGYAVRPQPAPEETPAEPAEINKRQVVEALLRAEPRLAAAEIARRFGVDVSYVRRIRRREGGCGE